MPVFVPAGTKAVFDRTEPSYAFSVETSGCVADSDQSARNPRGTVGTTVAFSA